MTEKKDARADKSIDEVVDRWFADHFHGSIVARNVDAYNHVKHAVEELKGRLRAGSAVRKEGD